MQACAFIQMERMIISVTEHNNENEIKKDVSGLGDDESTFIPGSSNNTYLDPLPSEGDEEALDALKSPFRRIWDRYSYSAVRIYLTQFAMGVFGASLALATGKTLGALSIAAGIFSLLFFAVLVHTVAWDIGASDRIAVDGGRRKRRLYTGALVGLGAGIPNFLLALLFTVTFLGGAHSVAAVTKVVMMFSEGMYWSLICNFSVSGIALHNHWWTYFLMALCTVLFVSVSYILGFYNVGLPKFLMNKGVEAERARREKKDRAKEKNPTRKD